MSTLKAPIRLSSNSLKMTGKPALLEPMGKGIKENVKYKWSSLKSEYMDGFSVKTLSSICFLFFACLAPPVAFGGLLTTATGGAMGIMECVGATALGGVLYACLSGQPLTIIAITGPLLAFLKVVYSACVAKGLPFLPVYSWIGLWTSLFLFLTSLFSTSNIVEYFTQFTDDIFASLVSVIFIVEAVTALVKGFTNPATSGIVACGSVLVALSTYVTAMRLKALRTTSVLPRRVRTLISDFAPTIGVGTGMGVASAIAKQYAVEFPKLQIADVVATTSGRPWLVPLMDLSPKMRVLCAVPALMATILLFMDQNITVHLVMSKKNKLKKGSGLHLDMLIISLITAMTSLLGMPWMVAATAQSVAHIRSLEEYEQVTSTNADGASETTPKFKGLQEQRVSGLGIHAFIGASVLLARGRSLLRTIPTSVLTGVFFYLGMSSIDKTAMWQRFLVLLSDKRDVSYSTPGIARAGFKKTNIFTLIQIALLSAMFFVKSTSLGVFFPVLIGLLQPVRIALEKSGWYTKDELEGLDGELD